ncbi:HVO_2901 family zinc finger protein [Halospeciosus flavus]|uniref:HVO_2901 family zinc finger protein n=1 Tax=Halospeciosus flavus TaxID=3032283 RepID=A0ABD5Z1U7_9EURY|nr:HVO_2901 family zinc finger protein [Halospeciosus flavus]
MPQLRTKGREMLRCRRCGSVFPEGKATRDGWRYECPEDGCDATGLGEALIPIDD